MSKLTATMLYKISKKTKIGSNTIKDEGLFFDYMIVGDDQIKDALKDGWSKTTTGAIPSKKSKG